MCIRDRCVFDAHFSDIVIICNIVLSCELSALLALSSRLNVLVRCEVIHYKRNLILVEYAAEACLVELIYRNWACNIDVYKRQVVGEVDDNLANYRIPEAARALQDFVDEMRCV